MEIILLQDVENLGDKHEVVTVKDGYGRNYLIPQKMGIIANRSNMARLAELKKQEEAREAKMISTYQEIADQLKATVIRIGAKAGTTGKIFGSVTNVQLAQAIKDQLGIEIERKKIEVPEEVKELGSYSADLHLHKEVEAKVNFEVVAE
ncbi:MAG: 50S ribosomal protein L9 [Saprospiraceae bacterium]|nr:50S ribosomal protein L9 [Saprospiraceae bacterium]